MPTRRNPVVRAGTILRKGGVHVQSTSGQRHRSKRSLIEEVDDWYTDSQSMAEPVTFSDTDDQKNESADDAITDSKNRKGRDPAPDGLINFWLYRRLQLDYRWPDRVRAAAESRP